MQLLTRLMVEAPCNTRLKGIRIAMLLVCFLVQKDFGETDSEVVWSLLTMKSNAKFYFKMDWR